MGLADHEQLGENIALAPPLSHCKFESPYQLWKSIGRPGPRWAGRCFLTGSLGPCLPISIWADPNFPKRAWADRHPGHQQPTVLTPTLHQLHRDHWGGDSETCIFYSTQGFLIAARVYNHHPRLKAGREMGESGGKGSFGK